MSDLATPLQNPTLNWSNPLILKGSGTRKTYQRLNKPATENGCEVRSLLRLLLVEANPVDRQAYKRSLSESGNFDCVVFEAETGNQGLKLLRTLKPDCILLNHHLPDLEGAEFLAELAEGSDEFLVPIVMLPEAKISFASALVKRCTPNLISNVPEPESLRWLPDLVLRAIFEQQAKQEKAAALTQLREMEAKYRTLVEQIPAITYIASLQTPGKLTFVSPQICQLGFPRDYWLEDPNGFLKRVHADDLSLTIESYAQTYEHHSPLRCEYRLINSEGQSRWFLDEANVVYDESGDSLFLQGVLVDISKDKETEQELYYYRRRLEEMVAQRTEQLEKQCQILKIANTNLDKALLELRKVNFSLSVSEQRFRLLLESAGEGIVGLDAEGRCTFVNRAALALLGYVQADILHQDVHAMLCQVCADESGQSSENWCIHNALLEHVPQRGISVFRRKDQSSFPVECSFHPVDLEGRNDGAVLVFWDESASQSLLKNLAFRATHDPLTGLYNRAEFEQRLIRVLSSIEKDGSEHVLCFFDLDHFKRVNDSCGHAAGDELLRTLGALLASKVRQRDTLARLGGDEFALLLEHTTIEKAKSIINELCKSMHNLRFQWGECCFSVSASIGMAAVREVGVGLEKVLGSADAACYRAKRQGGNRVHIYDSLIDGNTGSFAE